MEGTARDAARAQSTTIAYTRSSSRRVETHREMSGQFDQYRRRCGTPCKRVLRLRFLSGTVTAERQRRGIDGRVAVNLDGAIAEAAFVIRDARGYVVRKHRPHRIGDVYRVTVRTGSYRCASGRRRAGRTRGGTALVEIYQYRGSSDGARCSQSLVVGRKEIIRMLAIFRRLVRET